MCTGSHSVSLGDEKRYPWCINVTDIGSSVYPEARPNPFSWSSPPFEDKRYIFASSAPEAFKLFDQWLKEQK